MELKFHDFELEDIHGKIIKFNTYVNKICLIVNTASNCGLAKKNFEFLQRISKRFCGTRLQILLFPSAISRIINQEFANEAQTIEFANKYPGNYDIFKFSNINSDSSNNVFAFLRKETSGFFGRFSSHIKWNFTKFIVDGEGKILKRHSPIEDLSLIEKELEFLLQENSTG